MTDKIKILVYVDNVIFIDRTFIMPSSATAQLFLNPISDLIKSLTSTMLKKR